MKRLKKALILRNKTQRALANEIGVTEVTISRYVNGTRYPDAEIIVRICKALNISADWLLELI